MTPREEQIRLGRRTADGRVAAMTDPRMPPAGDSLLNLLITGLAIIAVSGMWAAKTLIGAAHRAHVAWIATQARIQALGVRVGDSLDRMELGRIDGEDE